MNSKKVNIKKVYLQKLGRRRGLAIWLVDGAFIRQHIYPDFVYGGNDQRYLFIPKGEIWIDSEVSVKEMEFTIAHEIKERKLMAKGLSYDEAHKKALQLELRLRKQKEKEVNKKVQNLELMSRRIRD